MHHASHGPLYLCSFRARRRDYERRKRVELLHLTATSDERAHIEVREERVTVHRAEWEIHGCEEDVGRVHNELPEGGR